jgi:hypothetical protein
MNSYQRISYQRIANNFNIFEISQIVTGKNANKSKFKASGQTGLRENKVNSPILFPILNAQNCTKTLSITRKTYNMFKLTCVVSYSL